MTLPPARLAYSAVDLRTGARFARHADEVFVSASLIKLPILVHALQTVDAGGLRLTDQLAIHDEHRVGGSGWLSDRHDIDVLDVAALLTAMIDSSDNAATNVLIDRFGLEAVAATATRLGLRSTALRRRMMDAAARARGEENLTSADDMSTLLAGLAAGRWLSSASQAFAMTALLAQRTTGRIDAGLPVGLRLAHKTGELDTYRHDAGIVLDASGPVAVVSVLTAGFPSEQDADAAIADSVRGLAARLDLG